MELGGPPVPLAELLIDVISTWEGPEPRSGVVAMTRALTPTDVSNCHICFVSLSAFWLQPRSNDF